MKISQRFNIRKSQLEVDFIDIDTEFDMPLFIDPYFLGQRVDDFSVKASRTIRSFFSHFISLMVANEIEEARYLFSHLQEPNETCLGLSTGKPNGRGVGEKDANKIFESIRSSRAVRSGLVEHLEDFRIFVNGIGKDKISDMTTNIIRKALIDYTHSQCILWNIPLTENIQSGFYWNVAERRWENSHCPMLVVDDRKILLVPKGVVSFSNQYIPEKYHRHYALTFLQHEHLRLGTALVQYRAKTHAPFVTKISVQDSEAPYDKDYLTTFTQSHREVFRQFRTGSLGEKSIKDEVLGDIDRKEIIDYLISELSSTPAGNNEASYYHRLTVSILEILYYPNLICPEIEVEINDGRRRIDLTFDNAARDGFFLRLQNQFQLNCQYIIVECKNYSKDIKNPELDQIQGRFSPNRGRVGLILSRTSTDKSAILARCNDIYTEGRGLVIPLFDEDLIIALTALKEENYEVPEQLLTDRLRAIALN